MANNIYRLLNEIETDFNEYEKTELSSKEKEALDEVPCNCIPGQCRCKEQLGL